MLMDEIKYYIDKPHEKIKLGSRLDEKNEYKSSDYRTSELKSIEILETVCHHMDEYRTSKGNPIERKSKERKFIDLSSPFNHGGPKLKVAGKLRQVEC